MYRVVFRRFNTPYGQVDFPALFPLHTRHVRRAVHVEKTARRGVFGRAVVMELRGYGIARYVVLRGLTPDARYRDEATGAVYDANALMCEGMPLPLVMKSGDYRGFTYLLERV